MTLLFTLLLLVSGVGHSAWAEPSPTTTTPTTTAGSEIKGDVLYWEGDELVVREMSGHEVRLRVTRKPRYKVLPASSKPETRSPQKLLPTGRRFRSPCRSRTSDRRSADHRESCLLPDPRLTRVRGCVRRCRARRQPGDAGVTFVPFDSIPSAA